MVAAYGVFNHTALVVMMLVLGLMQVITLSIVIVMHLNLRDGTYKRDS